jgi:hypothetical protein
MGYVFALLIGLLVAGGVVALILSVPARSQAAFLRALGPGFAVAAGAGLTLLGRAGIGLPLIGIGVTWWLRSRGIRQAPETGPGRKSTVRSATLEMELDHDTGELDGIILAGPLEGKRLSRLGERQLLELWRSSATDDESRQLLEAYLDRRIPRWRENAKAEGGAGQARAARSGAMTKQEAYQVLGLQPGAGPQEVRDAHRRLMKRVHPDRGGSTFLAARINEAKDLLLH